MRKNLAYGVHSLNVSVTILLVPHLDPLYRQCPHPLAEVCVGW